MFPETDKFARLFEAANRNVLPFQARMDAYETQVDQQAAEIKKKENQMRYLAIELAESEAQLHRILQIGTRLKDAAAAMKNEKDEEWYETYEYQMTLSTSWTQKTETCQAFLDELNAQHELSVKELGFATEWWQIMAQIASTTFNQHTLTVDQLHALDAAINLAQPAIDAHYLLIGYIKDNRRELAQTQEKLRELNQQLARIEALSAWYPPEGNKAAAYHLELDAIMDPLRKKIMKTQTQVKEYGQLQEFWQKQVEQNSLGIKDYEHVVAQLIEVRTLVLEI